MKIFPLSNRYAFLVSLLFLTITAIAQPIGANMYNPITVPAFPGSPYSDTRNNSSYYGYGNDIGNISDDIYYKVTLTGKGQLNVNHCNSNFDTYMFLLDVNGNIIASNDDNYACTGYYQASLSQYLDAGTYFVVSEGWSSSTGDLNTAISFQPDGATFYNPIDFGALQQQVAYSDTKNNSPQNGFANNYGQPSDDIYYKFTLLNPEYVDISHCSSSFDTYLHLLDASGNLIESNDDGGPLCNTLQSSINRGLPAGTYYVVSEGYGYNQGDITTQINIHTFEDADGDRDSVEFAQLPYFENNDFLQSFMDSVVAENPNPDYNLSASGGYSSSGAARTLGFHPAIYRIPVRFITTHPSGTTSNGGPTDLELRNLMDNLNRLYRDNGTYIQFYSACEPIRINDKNLMELTVGERNGLNSQYSNNLYINIFIADKLFRENDGIAAPTVLGHRMGNNLYLAREVYHQSTSGGVPVSREVLAHEMGHLLGLDHTFQYKDKGRCRREPVDRNRKYATITFCDHTKSKRICESTGDGLSDTPADIAEFSSSSCTFTNGTATDHFGDSYFNPPAGSSRPDPTNLMTYHRLSTCQTNFTYLQRAVMLWNISSPLYYHPFENNYKNAKFEFDSFEPDNSLATARPILRGESQGRNFNYQPGTNLNSLVSCDVDWASFQSPITGMLSIFTSQLPGYGQTNTILELYNSSGSLLASNDDIAAGNLFSQISFNFSAGTTYFIKIINKTPSQNGYYSLTVGCDISSASIQGPEQLCYSDVATYTIPAASIPPNATITWVATGDISISGSNAGSSVSVSANASAGSGELKATIASSCSGQVQLTPFPVRVGNLNPQYGEYMVYGETYVQPGVYSYAMPPFPGATSYEWFAWGANNSNEILTQDGTNYCSVYISSPGYHYVLAKATTPCGDVWFDSQQLEVYAYYNYYYGKNNNKETDLSPAVEEAENLKRMEKTYSFSPNPASNEINISYNRGAAVSQENEQKGLVYFDAKLYDVSGKVLRSARNKDEGNKIIFHISDFPNGTYFLHIGEGKHVIKKQLIIKH